MSKFVLHKHEAKKRGIHYDLRFEIPSSKNWASFSFNEFPPSEPGKRLYVPRSNDHSEKEANFIGIIPEGQYGAGKISLVDKGSCEIIKYKNSHIVVDFKGKKIKGLYHFINIGVFSRKKDYSKKVYAFFKGKIKT